MPSPTPQLDATLLVKAGLLSVYVGSEAEDSRSAAEELRALISRIENTFNFALKQSELRGDTERVLRSDIDGAIDLLRLLPDALDHYAEERDGERPSPPSQRAQHGLLMSEVL
jgi:hypothetical protein